MLNKNKSKNRGARKNVLVAAVAAAFFFFVSELLTRNNFSNFSLFTNKTYLKNYEESTVLWCVDKRDRYQVSVS